MKKIALFENMNKPDAVAWAEYVARKLKEHGAECGAKKELINKFKPDIASYIHEVTPEEFDKYADILVSFGGDGTMLSAARQMMLSDIPVMGINVGKLGFLAEFSVQEIDQSIDDLLKGNYRIVDRTVIETEIDSQTVYALNDFVIEKGDSSHMITIRAFANGHYIGDYRADGLILTTPTGSTAYSLSCSGPIIAPDTRVFCITPISPHSLTLRPLVIPDSNEIEFKIYSPKGETKLVADGHTAGLIRNSESVVFRRSEARVKLIKPLKNSYYDVLRNKLLWAANPIAELDISESNEMNNQ